MFRGSVSFREDLGFDLGGGSHAGLWAEEKGPDSGACWRPLVAAERMH